MQAAQILNWKQYQLLAELLQSSPQFYDITVPIRSLCYYPKGILATDVRIDCKDFIRVKEG